LANHHRRSEIALARLKQIGAKEYIAWWCPHCHEQKQLFGNRRIIEINAIECDPSGKTRVKPLLCSEDRKLSLLKLMVNCIQSAIVRELAQLSGYKARNFKNFTATP